MPEISLIVGVGDGFDTPSKVTAYVIGCRFFLNATCIFRRVALKPGRSALTHAQHRRYLSLFASHTKRFFSGSNPLPPSGWGLKDVEEFEVMSAWLCSIASGFLIGRVTRGLPCCISLCPSVQFSFRQCAYLRRRVIVYVDVAS